MFDRLTEQEKRRKYPAAPDFSTATTTLFSSPGELACFAVVDTSSTVRQQRASGISYFFGPRNLLWVPGHTPDPTGEQHSFATAISLFRSHGGSIHVFVRHAAVDDWFDVGTGILNGMHLIGGSLSDINIQLGVKLPEPLWLLFGGHPGWDLVINNEESEASSSDAVLDAIRDAWNRPPVDLEIGRYAGDTLFAIVDATGRATVSYYKGQDEQVSKAGQPLPPGEPTYIFTRSNGYDHEVPVDQVITRDEALSIIENFVMNGSLLGLSPQG